MKVGVITYHRSNNYGAQLQAYALIRAIEQLGHQAEVIDCNAIGDGKIFHWNFHSMRGFIGALRNNLLSIATELKRKKLFKAFVESEIPKSEECFDRESLTERVKQYDYVIVGSDQVWHPQICEGEKYFFLDLPIPSAKKIAYAPSFGIDDYTEEEANKYMPLINDIAYLSVREATGNKIIEKYLGRKVKEVVDPTMLLNRKDWETLASKPKYGKYLLYFTILDEPYFADNYVRDLAAKQGLKIVRIGTVRDIMKPGFINARVSGPKDFLSLVRNADMIVTSSFHGLVFSILFHRNFVCVLNNNERNSRLNDLANKLGIEDRLIQNIQQLNEISLEPIDYQKLDGQLAELREDSLKYLNNAIR